MKKKYQLFSKQWWKEFNRQSKEDKQKILEVIIEETMNRKLRSVYTDALTSGMRFRSKALYERYVQLLDKLDSHSEEWSTLVNKMLSEIRVDHLEYEKLMAEKERMNGKSTEAGNDAD